MKKICDYSISKAQYLRLWNFKNWLSFICGISILIITFILGWLWGVRIIENRLFFLLLILLIAIGCMLDKVAIKFGGDKIFGNVALFQNDEGSLVFISTINKKQVTKTIKADQIINFHKYFIIYEAENNYIFVPEEVKNSIESL